MNFPAKFLAHLPQSDRLDNCPHRKHSPCSRIADKSKGGKWWGVEAQRVNEPFPVDLILSLLPVKGQSVESLCLRANVK